METTSFSTTCEGPELYHASPATCLPTTISYPKKKLEFRELLFPNPKSRWMGFFFSHKIKITQYFIMETLNCSDYNFQNLTCSLSLPSSRASGKANSIAVLNANAIQQLLLCQRKTRNFQRSASPSEEMGSVRHTQFPAAVCQIRTETLDGFQTGGVRWGKAYQLSKGKINGDIKGQFTRVRHVCFKAHC